MILPLPIQTWSESSIRLARRWLKNCNESHEDCRLRPGTGEGVFRPTRLIDIGSSEGLRPKLCLGVDQPEDILYFTLSHCWGNIATYKLLQENLSMLKNEGIELHKLSKTFRQAIEVTRELGGRYIWIDSLCIIQDSTEDWRSESALMAQIYSHSFCNIAASGAKDGNEGLFFERDPFPVKQIKVCQEDSVGTHIIITDYEYMSRVRDEAPLSRRGWVFQEKLYRPALCISLRSRSLGYVDN